jgi:hypothetical protein
MRVTKLTIQACLLLLLCFTLMGTTLVQAQVTVGVSEGDVFEYDYQTNFNSIYSEPSSELLELNQTEWIRVTVTDISGSQITTDVTTHYKNGTEVDTEGVCDIDTGASTGGPPFFSANLNVYDTINPSASDPYYVNATMVRDYTDGQRETNLLKFEETGEFQDVGEYTRITEYYFDKDTGVLVEYYTEFSYTGLTSIQSSNLVSSSIWTIPEFPTWIILPLFVIVALSAIAVKKKYPSKLMLSPRYL